MKIALITGVTGQDGSYLSELLLEKGYIVYGLVRRTSSYNRHRIEHLHSNPNFHLIYGDLSDPTSLVSALIESNPDEVYNLAAQSHVGISFKMPNYTSQVNAGGVISLLQAIIKQKENGKDIKFYQASTSELYGDSPSPQNESTSFRPRSPYASSKLEAYWQTVNARQAHNIFACNGILFNHESPRRGENFVTRKIAIEVAKIKSGLPEVLKLGNIDSKRDWGHARDYVEAMWAMLQQDKPDDYVISTGESHSVREFVEAAFKHVNIPIQSNGKKGIEEVYIRTDTSAPVVIIDSAFFRPTDVEDLKGDSTKAQEKLSWHPKITFNALVEEMVDAEIKKTYI